MSKVSKEGKLRLLELKKLELEGAIYGLRDEVIIYLTAKNEDGEEVVITTYTADYIYKLRKPLYGLPEGSKVIEEYKGSKSMWAYKRRDYPIKRKWVSVIYSKCVFLENIGGKIKVPKMRFKKLKK